MSVRRKLNYKTPVKIPVLTPESVMRAGYQVMKSGSPFVKAIQVVNRDRRKRRTKFTVTPKGTVRTLRRGGGAIASRSRGFFRSGSKKWRKRKQVKYNRKDSFSQTVEYGKVQTGAQAVWVGHATWNRSYFVKLAGQNILGKLVRSAGIQDGMMAATESLFGLNQNDAINIIYTLLADGAQAVEAFNVPAGGVSFDSFGAWFGNNLRPWNQATTDSLQFTGATIQRGNSNISQISLVDMRLKIFVKSSMKIQNRSRAAAGTLDGKDDTDQVDNVPIYGKSYTGKGTQLVSRKFFNQPNNIVADSTYGVMVGSENVAGRAEPPQANEFTNVIKQGKAHLDPSEIKTSVLTSTHDLSLSHLMRACLDPNLNNIRYSLFGKFRVFCLEKMIDVGAEEPIAVAFEHNVDIYMSSYIQKKPFAVRQFIHING